MSFIFGMVEFSTRFFLFIDTESLCFLQLSLWTIFHLLTEVRVWGCWAGDCFSGSGRCNQICYFLHCFLGRNHGCILGSACFQLVVTPKYKYCNHFRGTQPSSTCHDFHSWGPGCSWRIWPPKHSGALWALCSYISNGRILGEWPPLEQMIVCWSRKWRERSWSASVLPEHGRFSACQFP